jgi:hypothetical protein
MSYSPSINDTAHCCHCSEAPLSAPQPFVRRLVNQQLSLFAEERSDVIAASADSEGRLWASMLFGSPGFMRVTPDSTALLVGADKVPAVSQEDPLLKNAQVEGAPLGFLM